MNNFKLPCSCLTCPYKIRAFHCTCGGISLPQAQKQMWDEQSTTPLSLVRIPGALLETNNSKNSSMFYSLSIPRLMKLSLHKQPTKLRGGSESNLQLHCLTLIRDYKKKLMFHQRKIPKQLTMGKKLQNITCIKRGICNTEPYVIRLTANET